MHSKSVELGSHFKFGENWSEYSESISAGRLQIATECLRRLVLPSEIEGKDVLDIGCGSGLHAAAALSLGARSLTAVDLDPVSVETTRGVLERFAPLGSVWSADVASVFDLAGYRTFPVVYSWGVLHHTGDMKRAIRCAAERVEAGGNIYLALYRKTPLCGFWRLEKRVYARGSRPVQRALEAGFIGLEKLAFAAKGRNFRRYLEEYEGGRGMDWYTDVKDWLGGYPYESISEAEMLAYGQELGLAPVRRFCQPPGTGLLGSGCDEYAFQKLSD